MTRACASREATCSRALTNAIALAQVFGANDDVGMLLWVAERRVGGELLVNALHEFKFGVAEVVPRFPTTRPAGKRTQAGGELARRAAASTT